MANANRFGDCSAHSSRRSKIHRAGSSAATGGPEISVRKPIRASIARMGAGLIRQNPEAQDLEGFRRWRWRPIKSVHQLRAPAVIELNSIDATAVPLESQIGRAHV